MSTSWYAPNQQAVRADGSGPAEEGSGGGTAPPEPPPEGNGEPTGLDAMTKAELLAYATESGVPPPMNNDMTKEEIRAAIDAHEGR